MQGKSCESASKKTSELSIFLVFLGTYLLLCISEGATHPEQSIDIDGARKKNSNVFEHQKIFFGRCQKCQIAFPKETLQSWSNIQLLSDNTFSGYHDLVRRDLDCRNERLRLIAFQNIKIFVNRLSVNIFLVHQKFKENRKISKVSSSAWLFELCIRYQKDKLILKNVIFFKFPPTFIEPKNIYIPPIQKILSVLKSYEFELFISAL